MSLEARGLYFELLAVAWQEQGIPEKPCELASWLGIPPKRFARLWAEVEDRWVHGAEGKLVNPRQERERVEAERVYEQRIQAGKKGGRPKANAKANGKPNG